VLSNANTAKSNRAAVSTAIARRTPAKRISLSSRASVGLKKAA
jgi:hypothetical protein